MAKVKKMAFGGTSRNSPGLSGGLQMRQNKANAGITARPSYNPTPGTSPLPSKKLPGMGGSAGPIAGVPAAGARTPSLGDMGGLGVRRPGMGGTTGPAKPGGFHDVAMKKGGSASSRTNKVAPRSKAQKKPGK
jgi:hypothetical protein